MKPNEEWWNRTQKSLEMTNFKNNLFNLILQMTWEIIPMFSLFIFLSTSPS